MIVLIYCFHVFPFGFDMSQQAGAQVHLLKASNVNTDCVGQLDAFGHMPMDSMASFTQV